LKEILIRYNIYQDIVEIKKNEYIYFVRREKIKGFTLQTNAGRVYTFVNGSTLHAGSTSSYLSYYQILQDGAFKLLAKHQKIILKDHTPSHLTGELTSNYSKIIKYYFRDASSQMHLISPNKKEFFALFNEKAAKVREIVKANSINIKKQQDLIKLFKLINAELH
jgi:hypothetical protein